MLHRHRLALIALAVLGLAASTYALYVHYQLMTDPAYSAACEISETVSCQQVFQSAYGSVAGVPVAAGGAIWSALVLLLAGWGMRQPSSEQAGRVAGYIFLLATIGLAAVFYFAYASFFVLGQACLVCMTMYISVAGIFLVSAGAATSLTGIPARLGDDFSGMTRSQTAVTLAAAWLAASIALVVLFPRDPVEAAVAASDPAAVEQPAEPVLETLTPEQVAEWEKFLDGQPRVADVLPTGDTKVLLVKFNDYQCPSCRQTWALYRGIIARYEQEYPEAFQYRSVDLPLEPECGLASNHMMACEAAAAVRMARANGKHREMEAWLFTNQSWDMTRDQIKTALQQIAQVDNFDEQYPKMLEAIRQDVQLGQKLSITGTPTFFVNGIQLSSLRPSYFDATIQYALRKAGVTS
jgi:vitamin-K-epoxide reductase (warfarin-sensitive)